MKQLRLDAALAGAGGGDTQTAEGQQDAETKRGRRFGNRRGGCQGQVVKVSVVGRVRDAGVCLRDFKACHRAGQRSGAGELEGT